MSRSSAVRGSVTSLVGAVLLWAGASCSGETIAEPEGAGTVSAAEAAAAALTFLQVSAGHEHSCGLTADNRAYCWGRNSSGQVGDGTTVGRPVPVPVAGPLRFRQISASVNSTCAVTTDFRAYCWGENELGQLGDGTTTRRLTPVAVSGGRLFRQVHATFQHACALAGSGGRVFCWGDNSDGQLGTGSRTGPETGTYGPYSSTPVRVAGTLVFRQVSVGNYHSCGVTTDDRAWCWGFNRQGQLGDSSSLWRRLKPTRVAGGHAFRQIDGDREHTCAVTTENRAYCWGNGLFGQLGIGVLAKRNYPAAVSGGYRFRRITAGEFHTCAETPDDRTYCWGNNGTGQLGDGTDVQRPAPVEVAGGHLFSQVSAGGFHACARTEAGAGYCWGRGFAGQLGNGGAANSLMPSGVAGAN